MAHRPQYLKKCEREGKPLPDSPPGLSASQAKGILITRPEKRTGQEALTIERMKMVDRHVGKCSQLFEEFARLFRERADFAKPNGDDIIRFSEEPPYRGKPTTAL